MYMEEIVRDTPPRQAEGRPYVRIIANHSLARLTTSVSELKYIILMKYIIHRSFRAKPIFSSKICYFTQSEMSK